MPFRVKLLSKQESQQVLGDQAPSLPVLAVNIQPSMPGGTVSAGDQAVLQDYLTSGNYLVGRKLKQVKDSVIGEPVKDAKGKPLEAYLIMSAGIVEATATNMMISNTEARAIKKQFKDMQAAEDPGKNFAKRGRA